MDPSIVVAIITGIAAIIAAVIQTVSAIQIARIKELGVHANPANAAVRSPTVSETHNRAWWWISGILIVTNFLWIILLGYDAPNVIHLGAIPWCTCLLAYFRPIRWAYVAGNVTFVSITAVFSFLLLGGSYFDSEIPSLAMLFVANSIVAAGIAFFRQR